MLVYESIALTVVAYWVLYALTPWASRRGKVTYTALAFVVHVPWLLLRVWRIPLRSFIAFAAGSWVFACLLCVVVGLPLLLLRLGWRIGKRLTSDVGTREAFIDEGRRQVLGSLALPAVAYSLGGAGAIGGVSDFVVVRMELRLRNWPRSLDGFRIGQITDTHVGDFISSDTIARAVDVLNDSGAHLHVMTGDLVDNLTYLESTFAALERCRAPYGMLAVLGNHEKMQHRLQPMLSAYAARRGRGLVRLLVDETEIIKHNGVDLRVIGVDYPMHVNGNHFLRKPERLVLMRHSAETAFAKMQAVDEPLICLSHHPDFFPLAAERNVSLTLSGHTHGGQIALGGKPLFSMYDYMLGHYQLGQSHLYVSGGTGHWLPYRYGVPTEVTVITLRSA